MIKGSSRPHLLPFVPLYRLVLALRERKFRPGSPSVRRLRWPVISIGNLSTGGAGKTPLTIALAKVLTARGLHVDVLSRGYGRSSALPLLVESGGKAEEFGDEPLEIARAAGVPVYVGAQRYEAGVLAESAAHSAVHLLDDGFQHRQLHRDVDILLLSSADLGDHLLPAGNLREPLRAAERADVIAIPTDEPDIADRLKSLVWQKEIWRLRRRMEVPQLDGHVAAFCGIARPEQFFEGLERGGVQLVARIALADHHRHTATDLARITTTAQKAGASVLLTTEKDRVRLGAMASLLPASLPLQTVTLRVEIENEDAAIDWLIGRITGPRTRL